MPLVVLIEKLKKAEREGRQEIENGDWARMPLPDSLFSIIVPSEMDDVVVEEMAQSGEWMRGATGFALRT